LTDSKLLPGHGPAGDRHGWSRNASTASGVSGTSAIPSPAWVPHVAESTRCPPEC